MNNQEIEELKQQVWDAFDTAIIDLRYNSLPENVIADLMEDALSRVIQLAGEVGVDPSDFM